MRPAPCQAASVPDSLGVGSLVQVDAQCTMPSHPLPPFATEPEVSERIRLTISVTPEVHAAFQRLAAAGGRSVGRSMGDWLGDTLDAVEFMAEKLEQARQAPRLVAQEMHAYALGLADETSKVLEGLRGRGGASGPAQPARSSHPRAGVSPPVSNTGGKGQPQRRTRGGKPL